MASENTIEDVKRDYRYTWEFEVEHRGVFKRCQKSCKALSSVMGVEFKAVYRHERHVTNNSDRWSDTTVNWDGEMFFAVNPKGKVISFTNSEWGGVGVEK